MVVRPKNRRAAIVRSAELTSTTAQDSRVIVRMNGRTYYRGEHSRSLTVNRVSLVSVRYGMHAVVRKPVYATGVSAVAVVMLYLMVSIDFIVLIGLVPELYRLMVDWSNRTDA